jgi:hypothetical protein
MMIEDYATGFSLAYTTTVRPTYKLGYYYRFTYQGDFELYYYATYFDLLTDEGRIIAMMWDIIDINDDNNKDSIGYERDLLYYDSNRDDPPDVVDVLITPLQSGVLNTMVNYWNAIEDNILLAQLSMMYNYQNQSVIASISTTLEEQNYLNYIFRVQ